MVEQDCTDPQTDQIFFSIVVPVYDRTDYVVEALQSVQNQTLADQFEALVILDGSPRETRQAVEPFNTDRRFRFISCPTPSGNAVRPRNRGIKEAKGQYILFLDSDDVCCPQRLEHCQNLIAHSSQQIDLISGNTCFIPGKPDYRTQAQLAQNHYDQRARLPLCYATLLQFNPIILSSVAVNRRTLLKYGAFRPEMKYREDHELWLRLAHRGCSLKYDSNLHSQYRIHAQNHEHILKKDDPYWEMQTCRLHTQPYPAASSTSIPPCHPAKIPNSIKFPTEPIAGQTLLFLEGWAFDTTTNLPPKEIGLTCSADPTKLQALPAGNYQLYHYNRPDLEVFSNEATEYTGFQFVIEIDGYFNELAPHQIRPFVIFENSPQPYIIPRSVSVGYGAVDTMMVLSA